MAGLFLLSGHKPSVAPGTKLVKAAEAEPFLSALELSAAISAKEAELEREAREAKKASEKDGYEEGLAQGRDEMSMKMMDTVMASVEYLEKIESDLASIVEEAVKKIIGDLPPDEVAVGLVNKALSTMRSDRRVLVRVSPADEPAVRSALLGPASGGSAFLDVRSDGRLSRGECVLESELGVVEASLQTQLKNLSAALRGRIKTGG
jgi:type III secretion protein L